MMSTNPFFVAIVFLAGFFADLGGWPALAADSGGHVVAKARSFDFGKVSQGETVSHCFEFSNTGPGELQINRMSFSLPGMKGRASRSIAAGAVGRLCLDLDTSSLNLAVDARADLTLSDPSTPRLGFDVRGFVSRPIDLMPMAVFADIFEGEGAERHIKIVNNKAAPLAIGKIEKDGTHFDAAVTTLEQGRVYDFVARIDPATPSGRYGEFAYLVTNDPTTPRIRIGINILVKRDIYALPQAVDFGALSLDRLKASPASANGEVETLMVKRRDGGFRIEGISSDVPGLAISVEPHGESQAFRIELTPQPDKIARGPLNGTIRIGTSDPAIPEITVPVRGLVN